MTEGSFSRYRQVADRLRAAIARGDVQPGQQLPSEDTLAAEYGLHRTTINKAVRLLAAEGLVDMEHGRGSRVREQRPLIHTSASYVTSAGGAERAQWSSEVQRQGFTGTQDVRSVEVETPPAEVAGLLGLDDDEQVVVRRRTMLADGEPIQLADSYYPASLANGTELAEHARMAGGTIAALERLGVRFRRFHERIRVRVPTREEAGLLGLSPGQQVIQYTRVAYDAEDRPVEVTDHVMTADRNVLTYDLPAFL